MSILAQKKSSDDPAPAVWLPSPRNAKVRTYRGKSLEQLLPRIRKDLGDDAVILREREGLMGGVGGFFATRFVEIEARAGGPSIDVYDEDDATEPAGELAPGAATAELGAGSPTAELAAGAGASERELPSAETGPRPALNAGPSRTPVLPAIAAPADVASSGLPSLISLPDFSASLDRALQACAVEETEPAVAAVAVTFPDVDGVADGDAVADGGAVAVAVAVPTAPTRAKAAPRAKARPATRRATTTATASTASPSKPRTPAKGTGTAAGAKEGTTPKRSPAARKAAPAKRAAAPRAKTPPKPPVEAVPAIEFVAEPVVETVVEAPVATVAAPARVVPTVAAPRAIDQAAAARISARLIDVGMSASAVEEILASAAAHGAAVAGGLRAAVRAEIARRLLPAPSLPLQDPALAFVGAGGAGKSVATAALAATYRYGSTLPVSVLSLSDEHGHRILAERLAGDEVPVASELCEPRADGLLIVDTPAASPGDPAEVGVLGTRLERLGLDAVLLVLPATVGIRAARRALSAFSPLGLTGLVISHRDESDGIGAIVELAIAAGLPVVYATSSGDHRRSLIAVSPAELAQDLLP